MESNKAKTTDSVPNRNLGSMSGVNMDQKHQ